MVRVFAGIPLENGLKEEIASFEGVLRQIEGIKVVRPENLHVTLKFIGDVQEKKLPLITEAIDKSCAGIKVFKIKPENLSAFPSPEKASVVWLDCGQEAVSAVTIFKNLDKNLRALAFAGEKNEYIPHITVARSRKTADITKIQGALKLSGSSSACCVVLYKSDLKPDGPVYTELYKRKLME